MIHKFYTTESVTMAEQRMMNLVEIIDQLEDKLDGEEMDEDQIRRHLDELADIGKIERRYHDDDILYGACTGVNWSNIHMIDHAIKKTILLFLIENPTTFFVLQQAQSGKMKICALEMKQWSLDTRIKPVAVFITQNDKTLADQSADGIRSICGSLNAEMFVLSSNSKHTLRDIKLYIDAYAYAPGNYKMPVIVVLANQSQHKRVMEVLDHILTSVRLHNSRLRYGLIFDEADDTYPKLRNVSVRLPSGVNVSYLTYINEEVALHRLGFVTATEGGLLDEDYPECANAYLYEVEIDETQRANFRGFHSADTIVKIERHPRAMSNNAYAETVLNAHRDYVMTPIQDRNDRQYFRKIIINSDMSVANMRLLAAKCNRDEIHALVFNQSGVTLYRADGGTKRFKVKGERFSERLYYIYKTERLNDRPLVIIGRRKVDRGLGFHGIPRLTEGVEPVLDGVNGRIPIDGIDGLVWTDMILGHIENPASAVQKAGRLQGVIAQCPQFTTITFWTDQSTADIVAHRCKTTDHVNLERGCSMIQAMYHAKQRHPVPIRNHDVPYRNFRIYRDQETARLACAMLQYRFRAAQPNADGFVETSLTSTRQVYGILDAIKNAPYRSAVGVQTHRVSIPCYTNVADNTTLRFVVVIRQETTEQQLVELDARYPSIQVPQVGAIDLAAL